MKKNKMRAFATLASLAVATTAIPAIASTVQTNDEIKADDVNVKAATDSNKNFSGNTSERIKELLEESVLNDKLNYKVGTRDDDGNFTPFSPGEARSVNPLHDVNNVRQGLIKEAIELDDWSTYYHFEAQQHPAHYNLDETTGKYVKNKEYYIQFINSSYSAYKAAKTAEDKLQFKKRLDEWIDSFNEAPASEAGIPYLVGINGNKESADEFGVPVASNSWFDSAFNDPKVIQNGYAGDRMWYENPLYTDNPLAIEKIIKDTDEYGSNEQVAAAKMVNKKYEESTDSQITKILLESALTNTFKYKFGTRDSLGNYVSFSTDEARAVNPLHDVNNVRQGLIQKAIETDDWTHYYNFEAKQHPAHYNIDGNGNAIKNKEYYVQFINSAYSDYKAADNKKDKELAEKRLQSWLDKFKDAPSASAGVPYLVGINGNKESADEFGVPVASNTWFDSAYNDPNVIQKGYAGDRMWYENPLFESHPYLLDEINAAKDKYKNK